MPTHNSHSLYLAGAVLAPTAVMFGAQFVGSAPASVSADPIGIELPQIENFSLSRVSEADRPKDPIDTDTVRSPFWFDEVYASENPQMYQAPTPTPKPHDQLPLPEVEVSSILPNQRNPLAVINGQPFKIGDDIEDGWKLLSIDGQARTVTLGHRTGKKIVVGLKNNP